MSLIHKTLTARQLLANRANAAKSTGPRTERGKQQARANALWHGLFSQFSLTTMKDLGEDPAAFERLRKSLYRTFQPQDTFERLLVEELAENRWRRRRLVRVESAKLATRRRAFELKESWQAAQRGRGSQGRAQHLALMEGGLAGAEQFDEAVGALKLLREETSRVGFTEEQQSLLRTVYGNTPGLAGALVLTAHARCLNRQDASPEGELARREEFLRQLEAEIAAFERLAELDRERQPEITEARKDAAMLPESHEVETLVRYEAALGAQFDRRLKQLIAWRQARPGRHAAVAGIRRRVGELGLKDHPRSVGAQK